MDEIFEEVGLDIDLRNILTDKVKEFLTADTKEKIKEYLNKGNKFVR